MTMMLSLIPALLLGVLGMALGPRGGSDDDDEAETQAALARQEGMFDDLLADLWDGEPPPA
jgi:hypothetical protein